MKIKIVLLTALFLAFSLIGFAQFPSAGSAHSSDQATAQEKKELLQLILKDKDVQGNITDGVSADAVAQGMTVKKIDLNKDGQPEFIVSLHEALPLGSLCGAHANCPNWVYRKTGSEYQLLLRDRGSLLSLQKTSTNGFTDLRSEGGDTAIEQAFANYKFDGNKYVAKGCYTRTYRKGQKDKITPFNCEQLNP